MKKAQIIANWGTDVSGRSGMTWGRKKNAQYLSFEYEESIGGGEGTASRTFEYVCHQFMKHFSRFYWAMPNEPEFFPCLNLMWLCKMITDMNECNEICMGFSYSLVPTDNLILGQLYLTQANIGYFPFWNIKLQ